jgi:hypothetical protein
MPRNQAILRGGELAKDRESPGSNGEGDCDPVFFRARWNEGFAIFLYFLPVGTNTKDLLELLKQG